MKLSYIVKDTDINIRQILKQHFNTSDRLITKLKKNNKIQVNEKDVLINYSIKENDKLEISLNFDEQSDNIVPIKMNLDILYEDDSMLVINKPAKTPVHPSASHFTDSLSNGVKYYYNSINLKTKIRIVNRLDMDTTGIVIFAKNEYIQEKLSKQMTQNIFCKNYLAIVNGTLSQTQGIINAPIARKENSIIERCVNFNGENAITEYEVLKEFNTYSLVYITLKTGRTHQIRVHMKHIGNPILGDTLYSEESQLIKRQALHAYKVRFIHPIKKEEMIIQSELPKDIKDLLHEKR